MPRGSVGAPATPATWELLWLAFKGDGGVTAQQPSPQVSRRLTKTQNRCHQPISPPSARTQSPGKGDAELETLPRLSCPHWQWVVRTSLSFKIPSTGDTKMGLGATPRVLAQSHQGAQVAQHGKEEVKGSREDVHPNLAKKEGPIVGGSSPVCPGKPPGPGEGRRERVRSCPGPCLTSPHHPPHRTHPAHVRALQLLTLHICSWEYSFMSAQKT